MLPDSEDESWAKTRLDPAALELLPDLLPKIGNPVSRAVVWGALRDGLLDARVAPDTYVDIACAALPHESDDLVLGRVLTESAFRTGTYLHTERAASTDCRLSCTSCYGPRTRAATDSWS